MQQQPAAVLVHWGSIISFGFPAWISSIFRGKKLRNTRIHKSQPIIGNKVKQTCPTHDAPPLVSRGLTGGMGGVQMDCCMIAAGAGVRACCRMSTASPTVIIASFSAFLKKGDWKIVYLCHANYYFRILEGGCELGSDSSARNTSARVHDDKQC